MIDNAKDFLDWEPIQFKIGGDGSLSLYLDQRTIIDPYNWEEPRKIFVSNNFDMFNHSFDIIWSWVTNIYAVCVEANRHEFLIYSRNMQNMSNFFDSEHLRDLVERVVYDSKKTLANADEFIPNNVLLGTYVTDQKTADINLMELIKLPGKRKFAVVSFSDNVIDIRPYVKNFEAVFIAKNDCYRAPEVKMEYIHDLEKQCQEFNVPLFLTFDY